MIQLGYASSQSKEAFFNYSKLENCYYIFEFFDNQDLILIVHKNFQKLYRTSDFREVASDLIYVRGVDKLCMDILFGVLISTQEEDPDGIINIDASLENNFFEAKSIDGVENFSPCVFGIKSNVENYSDFMFNLNEKYFIYKSRNISLIEVIDYITLDEEHVFGISSVDLAF